MTREQAAAKARALVAQMTNEEKASQVIEVSPAIERLGIPAYNWWNEALHGVARAGLATVFPQAIGMAASFDAELLGEVAADISDEARAKCNLYRSEGDRGQYKGLTFWSPNINIFRDPRWGRGQETYGEDPYLTSKLGTAFVKNLQGDGPYLKVAACAKHFAVHSGPEPMRHTFDAVVSKQELEDTYFPAFEHLVKDAGVEAVMGAYNAVYGKPCNASDFLLEKTLRKRWGFAGHVVSDCGAIRDIYLNHHYVEDGPHAAAEALKDGCDVFCDCAEGYVIGALQLGLITGEDLDRAVTRLLTTRMLLGEFEDEQPFADLGIDDIDSPAHRERNLKMAHESMVLLKNDGLLPLASDKVGSIAVVGPFANSVQVLEGNYNGTAREYVTLAEGVMRGYPQSRVYVAEGSAPYILDGRYNEQLSEAVAYARACDVTVLCVGLNPSIESEEGEVKNPYTIGDKPDLLLPEGQREFAAAIAAVAKKLIVLQTGGSALDLGPVGEKANAVLAVWYPGARGGEAAADILTGRVSPSGRLPVTFYRADDPLPAFTDYHMEGRTYRYLKTAPLYPFGFGLSYTHFTYANAACHKTETGYEIAADVTNDGACDGREVVQVYADFTSDTLRTPNCALCGAESVFLRRGETARVTVAVDDYWCRLVDGEGRRVAPDGLKFFVGGHQPDTRSCELGCDDCLCLNAEV